MTPGQEEASKGDSSERSGTKERSVSKNSELEVLNVRTSDQEAQKEAGCI